MTDDSLGSYIYFVFVYLGFKCQILGAYHD